MFISVFTDFSFKKTCAFQFLFQLNFQNKYQMSTQRGNLKKKAPKHKNVRAFKNDLYDTSHTIKKINELEFHGICNRCKGIIDWKVKYKKYKTLTTKKKWYYIYFYSFLFIFSLNIFLI
jgi:hypothetical protein